MPASCRTENSSQPLTNICISGNNIESAPTICFAVPALKAKLNSAIFCNQFQARCGIHSCLSTVAATLSWSQLLQRAGLVQMAVDQRVCSLSSSCSRKLCPNYKCPTFSSSREKPLPSFCFELYLIVWPLTTGRKEPAAGRGNRALAFSARAASNMCFKSRLNLKRLAERPLLV